MNEQTKSLSFKSYVRLEKDIISMFVLISREITSSFPNTTESNSEIEVRFCEKRSPFWEWMSNVENDERKN